MAPSFFSKLVKPGPSRDTPERPSSSTSGSSASLSPSHLRSRTTSAIESTNGHERLPVTDFGELSGARKVSAIARGRAVSENNGKEKNAERGYQSDSSANPSVHIVPPSPQGTERGLAGDSNDISGLPATGNNNKTINGLPSSSSQPPVLPVTNGASSVIPPVPPIPAPALQPAKPEMKHKQSAKSLKSIKTSPPSSKSQATVHNPQNSIDSTTSSGGHAVEDLVESPTSEAEFIIQVKNGKDDDMTPKPPTDGPTSSHSRSKSAASSTHNSPPQRKDKPPSRQGSGWRKPSSKPTGLAGAIAASGLAMANPGMNSLHASQLNSQARKNSLSSPPQLIRNQSFTGASVQMDHDNPPKRKKEKKRNSIANEAHNLPAPNLDDHAYYSGLESSDDSGGEFDDDSEDEGILGFGRRGRSRGGRSAGTSEVSHSRIGSGESLPYRGPGGEWGGERGVTGFAVASNRRNQEFHELFPAIPEGDYLIEDYGCALQREILVQGRLYISENHVCFHANILGWITDLSVPIYEITALEKKMTAFVIPNALQITTQQTKYTFASLLARDTTYDVIYNVWKLVRPSGENEETVTGKVVGEGGVAVPGAGDSAAPGVTVPKKTTCMCLKEGKHYTETTMDMVVPGTPDKIHNLMFASGFMKDFMSGEQKLTDIQISDWTPISPAEPTLLARNMTYIKPLNGPVGPKSTKCEIRDEIVHCDFNDYVSTISTTRNPDVPSGGVFSVKTRTCIMWENVASSRVITSTQIEWTGRSFIKGIIERSAIDGQRTGCLQLEAAMRAYIKEHQTEFIPEGVDLGAIAATAAGQDATIDPSTPAADAVPPTPKERERERNQRAFQWAWDTFAGAMDVGKKSAMGAIELIRDAWDQSETTTMLYFVIVALVLSNVYTFFFASPSSGKREIRELRELRRELRERDIAPAVSYAVPPVANTEAGEREKWIQGIVAALKEEMKPPVPTSGIDASGKLSKEFDEAIAELVKTLDGVEQRAKEIRQSLQSSVEGLD